MSDKILVEANVCLMKLFEVIHKLKLDMKVNKQYSELHYSFPVLMLAWIVGALDFVMSGEGKVARQHKTFINQVLNTNFTAAYLNASASDEFVDGIPFDYSVTPGFMLLAESVIPSSAAVLYSWLVGLLRCACAWDGERTQDEIARLDDVLEPIRQRFGIDPAALTLYDDGFWTNRVKNSQRERKETTNTRIAKDNNTGNRNLGEALVELDALIGLGNIKREVRNIANLARYLMQRKNAGLPAPAFSMHMVFTGNPGTGKTTVARLIAEIYRDIGILDSGHLIEVDRGGLVSEYLGQTALKTHEIFMQAKEGVLFIDEAYTLNNSKDGDDEYGNEAIATLLKLMEDHRDEVIVIVAGYTNEMKAFINANVGLQSRFTRYLSFEDYNEEELTQIFIKLCNSNKLAISKPLVDKVYKAMHRLLNKKSDSFGNAREVRTFFEQTMQNHANRLANLSTPTARQLQELDVEDIPSL